MIRRLIPWISAVILFSCSSQKADKARSMREDTIPSIVSLCESFDYADTAALHKEKTMASHINHIVRHMMKSDSTATSQALEIFFNGLDGDEKSLRSAARHANLFLNSPASPVRNETLYLRFLEALLNARNVPDDVCERAQESMRKTKLNRPGMTAADFRYIDRDGNKGSLHSLKSRETMLVFYDPECPHCPKILERIMADKKTNAAIEAGMLKVLAVYAEGKREIWEENKGALPSNWIVAYDLTGVLEEELYDLPAMPIVYLLDAGKRVLIKDMPW